MPAPDERLLPATTHMGAVELRTHDVDAMTRFYATTLGIPEIRERAGARVLGDPSVDAPLLALVDDREAPDHDPRQAGLYHTAFLFRDPQGLSGAVARLLGTGQGHFTGVGDHLVSQAFYFDDPEGNGVELYVDRPREAWTWKDGQVQMATDWFDPVAFLDEHLDVSTASHPAALEGGAAGLGVGHVHLQVGDTASARHFYVDLLGFEVTADMGASALFVSAGHYHHHMAMNSWNSAGAGRRSRTQGLSRLDVVVPDRQAVDAAATRLRAAGVPVADDGSALVVEDPWGTTVRLSPETPGR